MSETTTENTQTPRSLDGQVRSCASCANASEFDDEGVAICSGGNTPRYDDEETNYVSISDGNNCKYYKASNAPAHPRRDQTTQQQTDGNGVG